MDRNKLQRVSLTLFIASIALLSWIVWPKPYVTGQTLSDNATWTLIVDGSVANPLNLTYSELLALPKTTVRAELYCVDAPTLLLARGNWTGVALSYLLNQSQVLPGALKIAFHADDGYTSDLPVTTAMNEEILVAYELNDQPLPENLRLVVPGRWGYKWVSKLNHVEVVDFDFRGTWESSGYSDDAIMPLLADVNRDWSVDNEDVMIVVKAFGSTPTRQGWNEIADLDWNELVNIIDLTLVAKDNGKTVSA